MEENLAECRKHWSLPVGRGLLALVLFVFFAAFKGSGFYNVIKFGIPLLVLVSGIVEYATNYIAVTQPQVEAHMGFITSCDHNTPLTKIQAISISSGLFGNLLGYHKITIDHAGTGRSEYQFGHMANAKDFVYVLEHMTGLR